jgi:hypothetical protein
MRELIDDITERGRIFFLFLFYYSSFKNLISYPVCPDKYGFYSHFIESK